MKNIKLANRYAKALYDFSIERGDLEQVYQDVLLIIGLLKVNRELNQALESPVIPHTKKSKIFKAIFENTLCPTTFGFIKLVLEKKREPALYTIAQEFVKLYYKFHNIKIADFVTAQPVEQSVQDKLVSLLEEKTGSRIILKSVIMPKLIGGFIIKIGDFIYDASILKEINMLKREFSYNIYQAGF